MLDVDQVLAKVDTGARSSSLHAFNVEESESNGETIVSFEVHPLHGDDSVVVLCTSPLLEYRDIKSSNGEVEKRPVVRVLADLGGSDRWPIDLTLTNRDSMGFRMLLGREAMRGRFVVDPSKSFLTGGSTTDSGVDDNSIEDS
tara:strand:- start:15870 stop:16298 length:429 start_codon:yes stop_codon:yes gene_type:complete